MDLIVLIHWFSESVKSENPAQRVKRFLSGLPIGANLETSVDEHAEMLESRIEIARRKTAEPWNSVQSWKNFGLDFICLTEILDRAWMKLSKMYWWQKSHFTGIVLLGNARAGLQRNPLWMKRDDCEEIIQAGYILLVPAVPKIDHGWRTSG